MEEPRRSTLPEPATGLELADLFVPAAATAVTATPAARVREELPAALANLWRELGATAGWLPDTLFPATWLVLQARWLGAPEVQFLDGSGRPVAAACDVRLSARQWLARLDAARRTELVASADAGASTGLHWRGVQPGHDRPAAHGSLFTLALDATDGRPSALVLTAGLGLAAAELRNLLDTLIETAAALLENLERPLSDLRAIAAGQAQDQLQRWNQAPVVHEAGLSVDAAFAAVVRERPAATALVAGAQALPYSELAQRAQALAWSLRARGVAAGDRVGVILERSGDAVVALLGILQAGAAYVPVQADFPAERIAFMLADAGARLCVTTDGLRPAVPAGFETLLIEAPAPASAAAPPPFDPGNTGESVAYVMYTSGSTGTPKGIEICHRSILRLVRQANYVTLGDGLAMLHAAPLGFDASTLEIWGPLLNGGICVVHPEKVPTGAGIARSIAQHQVRTAWLTAGLFNAIVDDDPKQLAGLDELLTGGEALSVPHVRRALAALPGTRLINGYGPTECTTFAATHRIARDLPADARSVPIGRPINDTVLRILGPDLHLLPSGMVGELCIGGRGLARGYLGRPDLNAERFVADPFGDEGQLLYRTGDRARWLPDGTVEYVGRGDSQVKIRGHRIEPGEIEAALLLHPGVKSCAVVPQPDAGGRLRLVAYLVAQAGEVPWGELRAHLASRLPEPMLPTAQVWLAQLPITTNGKLDRRALPQPTRQRPPLAQAYEEARGPLEQAICATFAHVLELDGVGRHDNFFDLGGDSLRVLAALAELQRDGHDGLSSNLFFRLPTAAALAAALAPEAPAAASDAPQRGPTLAHSSEAEPVALIAMAGRFPGARDVEQFWDNLLAGRDTISVFDEQTLDAAVGAALRADPDYVRARGVLDGIEDFDAAFFGINPKEAELMDPQQRVFLEICWECLERGGYAPDSCAVPVGIWGGMNNATYFQRHLSTRPDLVEAVGEFQVMLGNEKDYIATRVAHRINLTGPAVSVHTACSTSLVAVHEAFHALRSGQCDMALAGGVAITCPPRSGYLYQEGSMLSPDGHTRSFDANAKGTVFSDGAAVVLLKRLSDALADGDPIYAVLRGSAVNNDGGAKASFTAPSVDGQAKVIGAALACAGVDARSISYVETHGTATPMGDPVEIEGLTRAFARHTEARDFCRIGSGKSNVGHMVMAAGAGGLIKTALALHTESLPASLHFEAPNPSIDFSRTPFRVNSQRSDWPRSDVPRRAGVSSFGVGGTNAHVIVEEAPLPPPAEADPNPQVLLLSARTPTALAAARTRLADHLAAHPAISLADVAHTLRVGRKAFGQRAAVVADSVAGAIEALRSADSPAGVAGSTPAWVPQPVFVFPGQGAQYPGMGTSLYASDRAFRAAFDECLQAFEGLLPFDLRERMFSPDPAALAPTSATQPATFALEYALARQWMALGVAPAALVGHSVGEFAAAVLAGVMSLADAARLVARRGALMQAQPPGAMLSVRLAAADLAARLPQTLSLAAENGPTACVCAGPFEAVEALRAALEADGIVAKPLQTSHAFHSAMMAPAVAPFEELVRGIALAAPALPIYSTLTGQLLSDAEATDPHYWARHLRETVRFSPAVRAVLASLAHPLFVEVGPRSTLSTLVRQHAGKNLAAPALPSLADNPAQESTAWRLAAARLWTLGGELDLNLLDARTRKLRVLLPTYPFERKRCWVDIAPPASTSPASAAASIAAPAAAVPAPTLSAVLPSSPPEPAMTSAATAAPDRRASLTARLRGLFEEISGIDLGQAEGATPFVEMGLDSLTLTQAAIQVKKAFKVNLTFRQLMESYRSFDALSAFLDATLPPEPAAATPAAPMAQAAAQPVTATPPALSAASPVAMASMPAPVYAAVGTAPGGGSLVQQVIAQQMQLMQQQLALLSGAAPAALPLAAAQAAPAAVPAAAAPVPAAAPATASAPAETDGEAQGPIKYDVKKAFGAIARIHTQASREPSERQKARLAAFIRRYNERTRKSKQFTADNRPHMADPRVVNGFRPQTKEIVYQVVVERSKGSRVWDLDGNEYVDALNGFGMSLFGWQPDFVQEAVRKQLELGYEIGPQHPLAADVTRRLCELTGFDRAALCNTGSEAVMAAIRIARTVTGRNMVVLFAGSYHGTFDEVLVRAGRGAKGMPAAPGIMSGMFGDVRVLDYGTPEALEFIRSNADDIAAVLAEPVQSRRPDFQPREFLREVRAVTAQAGSCLIFDEVITGFRSHLGGAQALFGIRADLACYGKVIGGGFPVGVIAGKREFMDALDGGSWQYGDDSVPTVGVTYFAGTFVRHPLALAACQASLAHLKEAGESLQTQLNLHTAAMADELSAFCREVGAPLEIRYFASLWRVSWLEDHPLQDLLFAMMRSRGVHILDNFPCFMTTAHTQQDIALIKSAFKESVAELQEAEFLPRNVAASAQSMDASRPPLPNARLGRDKDGQPAWFVPDPGAPGKFKRVEV